MTVLLTLALLTGCSERSNTPAADRVDSISRDTAAVVFGPSLTELFYLSGAEQRLAGVDRFSLWPPEASELPVVGDFLSPSMEQITALEATSIHVVGNNQSLADLAERLEIPCYRYSFDRLDDVYESCSALESIYPEADLGSFRSDLEFTLDSLSVQFEAEAPSVMLVIYIEGDGAITVAGTNTFYFDIIDAMGCVLSAPDTGSYPAVSVEGILSLAPDYVIILDPCCTGEALRETWKDNGLDESGLSILSGDYVLIPGARLRKLTTGIAQCLN